MFLATRIKLARILEIISIPIVVIVILFRVAIVIRLRLLGPLLDILFQLLIYAFPLSPETIRSLFYAEILIGLIN